MKELEVQFPGYYKHDDDAFQLYGTLRMPSSNSTTSSSSKFPAAIIIHGSGPIDRDGNAIMGFPMPTMKINTHNRLAEALCQSQHNMAVLCYDKRGIGESTSDTNKNLYYQAGMNDLVQDAVQAYRYLVEQCKDSVDATKIFLIGHSEGAILLPRIAEAISEANKETEDDTTTTRLPPPKGLIFLAGFGETLDGAARNQRERILKEVTEETGFQGWILRKVVTKEKVEKQYSDYMKQVEASKENPDDPGFASMYCGLVKVPTKWYREHLEWDSAKSLHDCTASILAVTGGKDVQVKAEYLERANELAPSAESVETRVVENMTHILRSLDGPASMMNMQKEYVKQGKEPLDEELLTVVKEWLEKQL